MSKPLLLLLLLGTLGAAAASNAPADKYFGRLKYSALRVRFTTQQLKTAYERHKKLPGDVEHMAAFTVEAFYEWAHTYPKDRWLASSAYGIAQLYEELPGTGARSEALRLLTFISTSYPGTLQARASARDLRGGLPVRPLPAWAVPIPIAPSGPPQMSPSARPRQALTM
ncbi:MAG: hypothetical protein ABR584_04925 [Candidatus Baltobacteraceae bacterium]